MWMSADNSPCPSTPSPAHPQSHPHRWWIAIDLSTAIPRSSTFSSTFSSTAAPITAWMAGIRSVGHPPPAPQVPTTYPHTGIVIHHVIHRSVRVARPPIEAPQRPMTPPVIYTGGHFSTRIGYLSTILGGFDASRSYTPVACVRSDAACLSPPSAASHPPPRKLSTSLVDNLPQMWMALCRRPAYMRRPRACHRQRIVT